MDDGDKDEQESPTTPDHQGEKKPTAAVTDAKKLKLRSSSGKGSTWTSSVHVPASDIPLGRTMGRQRSSLLPGQTTDPDIPAVGDVEPSFAGMRSKSLLRESHADSEEEEEEEEEEEDDDDDDDEEEEPVKMSLMSLLAEGDEELGEGGLALMMEEEEEEEDEGGDGGQDFHSCCVCMVKHKGTAFEPCGHSFCRLCSKEMWVDRGSCPLCNNYVLEILDFF